MYIVLTRTCTWFLNGLVYDTYTEFHMVLTWACIWLFHGQVYRSHSDFYMVLTRVCTWFLRKQITSSTSVWLYVKVTEYETQNLNQFPCVQPVTDLCVFYLNRHLFILDSYLLKLTNAQLIFLEKKLICKTKQLRSVGQE